MKYVWQLSQLLFRMNRETDRQYVPAILFVKERKFAFVLSIPYTLVSQVSLWCLSHIRSMTIFWDPRAILDKAKFMLSFTFYPSFNWWDSTPGLYIGLGASFYFPCAFQILHKYDLNFYSRLNDCWEFFFLFG